MSDGEMTPYPLRLPTALYEQYAAFAAEDERSRNYVMCVALAEYAARRNARALRRAARRTRPTEAASEAA